MYKFFVVDRNSEMIQSNVDHD